MNCPSCNSDSTQRLEVIFEQGTSHINTTSKTRIRPFLGLLPSAHAKTSTSGLSISKAAQKAAPPAKISYKVPAIATLIGLVISFSQFGGQFNMLWFLIGLALLGVFGWVLYRAVMYNTKKWPADHAAWQKSWMCNKCGNLFAEA